MKKLRLLSFLNHSIWFGLSGKLPGIPAGEPQLPVIINDFSET
jgi:hypothetical protein